jgi:hypothetical protein
MNSTAWHSGPRSTDRSIEELQTDLDGWLKEYNELRPHSGKYCYGKTPMQTFLDGLPMTREKMIGFEKTA